MRETQPQRYYAPILEHIMSGIAHDPVHIEEKWLGLHQCVLVASSSAADIGILAGNKASVIKSIQDIFAEIGKLRKDEVKVSLRPNGDKREMLSRTKSWDSEDALDYADYLLHSLGWNRSMSIDDYRGGIGLTVVPPLDILFNQVNTVLEAYGRSRNKAFGLAE